MSFEPRLPNLLRAKIVDLNLPATIELPFWSSSRRTCLGMVR